MLQFSTRSELAMQKRSFTLRRRPLWASLWPTLRKYDNNVGGSLSLFRAMIDAGCRTLVFSSSCAVYGEPKNQPIGEASPMAPCNPLAPQNLWSSGYFPRGELRLLTPIQV